ncbi:MAG: hypothetical protein AAFU64_01785 [Bacteroidota bacterium]
MKKQDEKKSKSFLKKSILAFFYLWALGLIGINASLVYALDLRQYLNRHQHQNDDQFLADFPYQTYQEQKANLSLNGLEADRQFLNEQGRPGDKFLYHFYEQIAQQRANDIEELGERFAQAEAILAYAQDQEEAMVYEIIAQSLLENIAQELEDGIKEARYHKNGTTEQALIQQLQARKFFINIPKSNWEKLQYHIAQGHWAYIGDRAWKEFGAYLPVFLLGLILFGFAYYHRSKIHLLMLKKS